MFEKSQSISTEKLDTEENPKNGMEKLQFSSLEELQKYNIDSLNTINKLKSPNFEQILSRICNNIDLRDESLNNNNELDENKIKLLTNLFNKLNGKNNGKEKKKKSNKVIKDGMGLLLSLDVSEAPLLYHSYANIIKNKFSYFDCYLYSMDIPLNIGYKNIGFIFPIILGELFQIKLINRKNRQIGYVKIKKEKRLKLIHDQMMNIITYHLSLCNQLLRGKKNFENELIQSYMKNLCKNDIYKKYFFVPLKQDEDQIDIDENKIIKCVSFINEKCPKDLFPRISELLPKNNKEKNKKYIFNLLENAYFVTDYKINRLYKFENIIFKDDKLNTFLNKYTFNEEELKKQVKIKLLESIKKNNLDAKSITAKYIMEELPLDNDESNSILGGIIGYRKIPQKYKIEISNKNIFYLTCKFGSLNNIRKTNFTYNINLIKNNPYQINKADYSDNSQNDNEQCAKILPPDRIFSYYIEKNDIDLFEIIPSIFLNFEELVKIPQFIKDYGLLEKKSEKEKKLIDKNYQFLQWAFTLHMSLQDYNYEALETLGDSILKMIATILVYHIHEINDIETDVGELVFNRATLICNLHLFSSGKENKIYNYLIRYPKEIRAYTFPLEHEFITTGRINISEKIIADIVESSIGGIFLCSRNTKDCFNYIRKLNIPFVEKDDSKYKQSKGAFSKNTIWENKISYNILVNKAYGIMEEKMKNFGKFIYPEKIRDLIKSGEMNQNINLFILMQDYLLKCNKAFSDYKGVKPSLDYLQKCRIFYTFKNIKLLEQAMTHKSKNPMFSQNYEKLELLGDSIVEGFISQYTFCIFGPYLFEDNVEKLSVNKIENDLAGNKMEELIKKNAKEFNNKYMTHIKSYLCSNYFMCKLSILIGLPIYIKFGKNDINNKSKLKKFLDFENTKRFCESNLNNYISTETFQPKFIADLFEALIGAIYTDSDLKTTYEFLELIYGPSICYSCLFLKELPFSIVADFTERCSKEIKIVPSFKNATKDEIINSGFEYDSNKVFMKLTIGELYSCVDKGDNEEKARENLSEKGIIFLDNLRYEGPSKYN